MRRAQLRSVHILMLTALLGGCGAEGPLDSPPANIGSSKKAIYADSTSLWSSSDFPLRVCTDATGMDTRMSWVREGVDRSWSQVANVDFRDFGRCGSDPTKGVKINWVTSTTGRAGIGKPSNGDWNYMKLGTDANWPEKRTHRTGSHEFGHVLGFLHEQDRSDFASTPDSGDCKLTATSGDTYYGTIYDPVSMMNYCWNGYKKYNTIRTNSDNSYPAQLSPGDVVGALEAYGRKPRHSVVGVGGKCLTASSVSAGAALSMQFCKSSAEQRFTLDHSAATQQLSPVSSPNLEVRATATSNGTQAKLYYASSGAFYLERFKLSSMGLCLASQGNGKYVRMNVCNDGDDAQSWYMDNDRLINADTGQCLRRWSNNYLFTSSNCTGDDSQVAWIAKGQFRLGFNRCVDVKSGYDAIGYQKYDLASETLTTLPYVQMFPCKTIGAAGSYNQAWIKRGQLHLSANPNKCLDVKGNVTEVGAKAQVFTCKDSTTDRSNQMWDLYW